MSNKITHKDYAVILDGARRALANQSLPLHVSGHTVYGEGVNKMAHETHLAVMESLISFLNNRGLLREPISIDYRQDIAEPIDE
jgi:hypothetical protein